MRTLRRAIGIGVLAAILSPLAAAAHDAPIDVLVVEGAIDGQAIGEILSQISESASDGAQLLVIQLDSPAVLDEELYDLIELVRDPPLPLAVWVGPAPAVAYGGAALLVEAAPMRFAAEGTRIGHMQPVIAGGSGSGVVAVVEDEAIPGLVDEVHSSLRQLLASLDGRVLAVRGLPMTIHSIARHNDDGSIELVTVRFVERSMLGRTLALALSPHGAFFFLVLGAALVVFEMYAVGPGLAAAAGAVSLLLAGYGISQLPVRLWALALALVGLGLWTIGYQRGRWIPWLWGGLVALLVGGFAFTDAAPQLAPAWWAVLLTVAFGLFMFVVALPVVGRARFSTPTLGRGHLIGAGGVAVTALDPEGDVLIGDAKWRARAHREAGIEEGDAVVVSGLAGLVLEVEPADREI